MRADAEEIYGQQLGDIQPATDRIPAGFQKDEGASVKKVGRKIPNMKTLRMKLNILAYEGLRWHPN